MAKHGSKQRNAAAHPSKSGKKKGGFDKKKGSFDKKKPDAVQPVKKKVTAKVNPNTPSSLNLNARVDASASSAFHQANISNPNPKSVGGVSDKHRVLVVGDGDFSFSLALATRLADIHVGVDATNLARESWIQTLTFDRIVFNFPHLGGATEEDVEKNQDLLWRFFQSARKYLDNSKGEVHVALRNTLFYNRWDVTAQATKAGLKLKRTDRFNLSLYPGYEAQRTHPASFRGEPPSTDGARTYVFSKDLQFVDPVVDATPTPPSVAKIPAKAKKSAPKAVTITRWRNRLEAVAMALTVEVPRDVAVSVPNQASEEPPHHELTTPPVSDKEDEPARSSDPERFELEAFTPFSSSHLWKLMSSFYDRQGVESWAQGIVPHFITSNTFIAKRYVQVFAAYLRDAVAKTLDPTEPLYIVELGTGSGKFSFYFVQWLYEMEAVVNLSFPLCRIRYIMTDFTDSNLKFWQTHPALRPFVERGVVDFAIFDATQDTSLYLINAKQTIAPQSLKNPICVVANYLFDTLHHELFRVDQTELKQGLISVGSTRLDEKDPLDPEIIKRLSNLYRYDDISTAFYSNPHFNAILKWYQDYYGDQPATFLVPIGALNAIERLKLLSRHQLLILSGDKGHTNPDHFRGLQDPHIAVHGSFSVSLFVVPQEIELPPPQADLEALSVQRSAAYPTVCHVYDDTLEDAKAPSLKGVLALMKLSFYDADLFYKFRDVLLDLSPAAPAKVKVDVMVCLNKTWTHYYQLDKEKCFEAATKLNSCYQKAATWLQRVTAELHPTAVVAANNDKEDPLLVSMQHIDLDVSTTPVEPLS
ncbi:hypothetical protein DYB35_000186 [Aphanomyces astaci]|uniref:25S rRNA (uridine-N(3))-methyltransferase BMT5-like domain-containing protein n=1 Tax=Aphanomyces astaci TaxID=112090 RepID=A0A3R6W804_APHAT|nr:hypothetical protein DYB35_000186 [Aphanomyces astaci]